MPVTLTPGYHPSAGIVLLIDDHKEATTQMPMT